MARKKQESEKKTKVNTDGIMGLVGSTVSFFFRAIRNSSYEMSAISKYLEPFSAIKFLRSFRASPSRTSK